MFFPVCVIFHLQKLDLRLAATERAEECAALDAQCNDLREQNETVRSLLVDLFVCFYGLDI